MQRYIFFSFLAILFSGAVTAFSAESAKNIVSLDILETIDTLDLKTCQSIALEKNPSVAAAADRLRQAAERVRQAQSAYLPGIDAEASGARVWYSDTQLQSMGNPDDPDDVFSAGLTAAWVLFNGFEREFRNAAARYGEQESKEALADARRLLLNAVASAYFNAQLARENIVIAEADKAFYQRQTKEAEIREKVGTGSFSDVLNFEIQLNSASDQKLLATQQFNTALIGLAALLGVPDAAFPQGLELAILAPETPEEMLLPETEPLIRYAQAHRPDILKGTYALKTAEANISQARAGFYPKISLVGNIEGERTDDAAFDSDDLGSSIALVFSYNLFEGGYTRYKIREASAGKTEAENNLTNIRNTAVSEVLQALEALKSSQERLKLQRTNAALVRQNRDLVEKEYNAGQTSLVRLNEAQRDLTKAQSSLVLSLASLRQAWQNLEAATGQILIPFSDN